MPAVWDAYRENILTTLADVSPASQLVAEQQGVVVGAVLLYPAGHRVIRPGGEPTALGAPEVRLLAVPPAGRGRGIGEALMGECARRARLWGADVLALHTTDRMQAAVRLYERLGFQRAPELDFRPAPDVTAKGYRLALRPPPGTSSR